MESTMKPPAGKRSRGDTAQRILDAAEELVQTRGFNAFSYADVAAQIGITKASLHYHFPSKAELGQALIARYSERFVGALSIIDEQPLSAPQKLDAYARLYADVFRAKRMCLCGMLAAEYQTLPSEVRGGIVSFFDDNEAWVTAVLERGSEEQTLAFEGPAHETAQSMIGGLEGAMLVARPHGDVARFEAATRRLLSSLSRS